VRRHRKKLVVVAFALDVALHSAGCVIDIEGVDFDEGGSTDSRRVEVSAALVRTLPAEGRGGLILWGGSGSVVVCGVDGAQEVGLQAVRRVRSHSREDALDHLDLLQVLVQPAAGEVEVRTVQPAQDAGRAYEVDYEVTVPAGWTVRVAQGNGTVSVWDLRGTTVVENGNGDVALSRHRGSGQVSLGNGEIRADVGLPPSGELVLAAGNGGIRLTLRPQASAAFAARIGNGVLDVAGLAFTQWVATPRSASGVLGSGAGVVDLSVGNGWIQVRGG
jgi:hypothetical protein